jgi:hypothetical protein
MSMPTHSPEPQDTEPKVPGRLAPYWFVIVCGLLMLGVVGAFVMVRYGHWTPLALDTKIDHPKPTF